MESFLLITLYLSVKVKLMVISDWIGVYAFGTLITSLNSSNVASLLPGFRQLKKSRWCNPYNNTNYFCVFFRKLQIFVIKYDKPHFSNVLGRHLSHSQIYSRTF